MAEDNNIEDQDKPKSKRVKKTAAKKAAKKTVKKAVKKTAKKTTKKAVKKKSVKTVKKATKKTSPKKAVKKKKVIRKEDSSPLQTLYQKTTEVFDNLIEDIKGVPKKPQENSKNSNLFDSFTSMITQTKNDLIKKKDEFTELHHLNSTVSTCKKEIQELYTKLGKECFNCFQDENHPNDLLIDISKQIQCKIDLENKTKQRIEEIIAKK